MSAFGSGATLATAGGTVRFWRLDRLEELGLGAVSRLPASIKVLLEGALRHAEETPDSAAAAAGSAADEVVALAGWADAGERPAGSVAFRPGRVVLQDFTGIPALLGLAAMRSALARVGGDPARVDLRTPTDLVIDHSLQVDTAGTPGAAAVNLAIEFERNAERYRFARWAQQAFAGLRVVPPGKGIVHQVNMEFLASVVSLDADEGGVAGRAARPVSVVSVGAGATGGSAGAAGAGRDGRSGANGAGGGAGAGQVWRRGAGRAARPVSVVSVGAGATGSSGSGGAGGRGGAGIQVARPDTVVGTDSHTTMIGGVGVLGWGVGGIEAEAVMLGEPIDVPLPRVTGVRLDGRPAAGVTGTDLVLAITAALRQVGVVGDFVEFWGPGTDSLSLEDRATIANMAPEYGATTGFFAPDAETLRYLRRTNRSPAHVDLVERYCRAQGLFRTPDDPEPAFSRVVPFDLATVEPLVAGPSRPTQTHPLADVRASLRQALATRPTASESTTPAGGLRDGDVVIAAITSCTNTSNPAVMVGAGLLARNAVQRGLATPAHVKASLAPGSPVVADYLARAGLLPDLEKLGFAVVGFGCTTCAGGSGPLDAPVAAAIEARDLAVAAVLSGNRNFEGRIHPQCRLAYLASPPLVVAYALAGTMDIDLTAEPLGTDPAGQPVLLADLWPDEAEIQEEIARALHPGLFAARSDDIFEGDERWQTLDGGTKLVPDWDASSTYITEPPWCASLLPEQSPPPAEIGGARPAAGLEVASSPSESPQVVGNSGLCPAAGLEVASSPSELPPVPDISGVRCLVLLGDGVTTDHISPAGAIDPESPAGRYLLGRGIAAEQFSILGARRGNHEVMVRATFANPRLRNHLAGGREGGWTVHHPTGAPMTIFDAAERYRREATPLLVLAGDGYGAGSSRDWAAKGTALLGVRAVIANSFERLHRQNLIGMGVLPLQFAAGPGGRSDGDEADDAPGGRNGGTDGGKVDAVPGGRYRDSDGEKADDATGIAGGLDGTETYDIVGLADGLVPGGTVTLVATAADGSQRRLPLTVRLDSATEVTYYRHGGIVPYVFRRLLAELTGEEA